MSFEEDVDFLAHFGVKGMKWGVRRTLRKEAISNFEAVGREAAQRQHVRRNQQTLNEESFNALSNKDVVVKKGSTVSRVSQSPTSDRARDALYVSTNQQDAANYRAAVPTWNTPKGHLDRKYKDVYETTYKATADLKSPSERKRVEGYIKLMDEPAVRLSTGETITGRQYLERQGLGKTIEKLSSREIALQYYGQLIVAQGIRDEPLSSAYFKAMKDKGYNALIDDNDAGILAKTPLLALASKETLAEVSVTRLTPDVVYSAQRDLTLP